MSARYDSKHGLVSRPPFDLYMGFCDLRNMVAMLPEDKKKDVQATYDTLEATVQGFKLGVKVIERTPYSKIVLEGDGIPFAFTVEMHFDAAPDGRTDFWVRVDAELNAMLKMMLGKRLQEGLDQMVDALVAASEGRRPDIPDMKF